MILPAKFVWYRRRQKANSECSIAKAKHYTRDQRDDLQELIWTYAKSTEPIKLYENRFQLLTHLEEEQVDYVLDNWFAKEHLFVNLYTNMNPNLNSYSTQRAEGFHAVMKALLNPQLSCEEVIRTTRTELKRMHRQIREKEEESRTSRPRGCPWTPFQLLMGHVTIFAMEKIRDDWVAAVATKEAFEAGEAIEEGPCACALVIRFGLPCRHRHYLLESALGSFPIPLTLLHPRWRLDGPEVVPSNWHPHIFDGATPPSDDAVSRDVTSNKNARNAAALQSLSEQLPKDRRDLLSNQFDDFTRNVTKTHKALELAGKGIPVGLPKAPKTHKERWAELKAVRKGKRIATAAEAAEKAARKLDRDRAHKPPSSSAPPAIATPVFRPPPELHNPSPEPVGEPTPPAHPPAPVPVPAKKKPGPKPGSKRAPKPQPLLPPTNPPPPKPPSPPPRTGRHARPINPPKKWEPKPSEPKRRQRGPTLEAEVIASGPTRKRSKAELREVKAEEVEDRESQQKRIIRAAFVDLETPR